MARFVDPLVVGRVIGEVVDLFVPSISMTVAYDGPKDISNGCLLKPSATAAPPLVRISGRRNDLYTLIMTDPDAPSPSNPTMREYLHWIVINIPGGTDATKGEEVVEYMGPRPPVGIHRIRAGAVRAEDARARGGPRRPRQLQDARVRGGARARPPHCRRLLQRAEGARQPPPLASSSSLRHARCMRVRAGATTALPAATYDR
uniref:MFT2-Corn MFT-like protein n=1 Tax=Zea mays TaxID=4577 RepID=B6UGY2_MAIZE|nr:MFT2 - Corn MFT-like protein [Zea mays]